MVKPAIKIHTKEVQKINSSFAALTDSLQREVQRKIITAVGTGMKKEYRKRTPRSKLTGTTKLWSEKTKDRRNIWDDTLKKALVSKPSSKWRNKKQLAQKGIVGVTVGYDYTRGHTRAANYAHLVNDGHVAVYWGRRGGGRVAGIHWQKPAMEAAAANSRSIVAAKAKQAITAAVIKAAKKSAKKANK